MTVVARPRKLSERRRWCTYEKYVRVAVRRNGHGTHNLIGIPHDESRCFSHSISPFVGQSVHVLKKKLALRYFATLLRPFRNFYWTSPFSSLLCWATGLGIIRECKKR